jgi:hypothetical protein
MSPLKEPNFFAAEVRPENFHPSLRQYVTGNAESMSEYLASSPLPKRFGGMISTLGDYERLFAATRSERAVGEGSVCYLWSASAASAIASTIPGARIIIVLMNPAERAFHQYLKSLSDGNVIHSFAEHLELAFEDTNYPELEIRLFNPFLSFGQYARQLKRYLQHFSREQLSISLYEDTEADYARWFAGILEFIGAQANFSPADVEVPSTPHFVGNQVPLFRPEERARLVEYYREEILELEDLIHRDLGAWLR